MAVSRFPHNSVFDAEFGKVPHIRWFPYVGQKFGAQNRKLMVFAHNIPMDADICEERREKYKSRSYWSDCIEEYVYCRGWWTKAFRYFVKGAVGLAGGYDANSPREIQDKVDTFISQIAYLNFVQDLVAKTSKSSMVSAKGDQVDESKEINRELLRIMGVTHCICWGKPTYGYVTSLEGWRVLRTQKEQKKSFASCVLEAPDGRRMHVLKIAHPSMPGRFGPYTKETQDIIADFMARGPESE